MTIMGFDKKYITKELILSNIKKIDNLFNADAIITFDKWSSFFFSNINTDQRNLIKALTEKYQFISTHSRMMKDLDYQLITSHSEILISLCNNGGWLPIVWSLEKLKIKINNEESGRYKILTDICIKHIIEYIDNI